MSDISGQFCRLDGQDDKPEDWLLSALAFASALSFILDENEGIAIKAKNAILEIMPDVKSLIIYKSEDQIHIEKCYDDLLDGQMLWMD